MKILLNAVPRTRSKWMVKNLYSYLSEIGKTHNSWPIFDIFTETKTGKLYIENKVQFDGENLTVSNDPVIDIDLETKNRLDYLKKSNLNMCIKVHPTSNREINAIAELKPICTNYFTLSRKDLFEQSLSMTLALFTNEWTSGINQTRKMYHFYVKPISIDINIYEQVTIALKEQNEWLKNEKSHKLIYMEDTLTIRDARDFCEMLDLEFHSFNLDQLFDVEFGSYKKNMISNYNELKSIYESIISNN